jgi:hypothetical protein
MKQSKNISIKSRGLDRRNLRVVFLIKALVLLTFLSVACTSTYADGQMNTLEPLTRTSNVEISPTIKETKTPIVTGTIFPTATSTSLPLETPELETVASPTRVPTKPPTPTSTPTPVPISGSLFIAAEEGFLKESLESGEQSYLLEYQADWLNLRASFSPGNEQVVYWVKTDEASELWTTPLSSWAPERLLYLPGTDYVNVQYYWLNTERHLFVHFFAIDDTTGVLEVPVASYIIDLSEKTVLSRPGWYGICTVLAVSPQTNHLSTWCPMENEPSGQAPFLVIELDESVWISEDAPQIVLTERENWADWNGMWQWSGDGKYVVYTIIGLVDGEVRDTLYYSPTDRNEPVVLSDGRTDGFGAHFLSPDGTYIAYEGICPNGIGCQLVMQTTTQDIVWTSQMVDPQNSSSGGYIYWSPDGRFFARNGDQGVMIIDIITKEVVLQFDYFANAIAWLDD